MPKSPTLFNLSLLFSVLFLLSALPGKSRASPTTETAASEKPMRIHSGLHYYTPPKQKFTETLSTDVCIYGGTSAGVVAAVQLRRAGRNVVLLEPSGHLGGMTTGGLSYTDIGNKEAIGGISREFYQRVGKKYNKPEEWCFEPHVAEQVYEEMVEEAKVPIYLHQFLKGVIKREAHLIALTTESGLTVKAEIFIDATYEGDLMALAGVHYRVGREANKEYHETLDGVQVRNLHQFDRPIDPYIEEGERDSGLLPGIDPTPRPIQGTGDSRVQAYNFRLCLTRDPNNRIPISKPKGYDPKRYVLLTRLFHAGWRSVFNKFDALQGGKFDMNNFGPVSTDFIGENYKYPDGDYKRREKIYRAHVVYQQGLLWFLTNDPSVPEGIRTRMAEYGLCKDEFVETGGWPAQLYVREARRMISDRVMTEHNCRGTVKADDPVGLAAYTMDSHNCRRFVEDGSVRNEGDVEVGGMPPYPISYRSIVPKKAECDNLLVPVCLSATHIAYGSIRMEPVFMILGQSAAIAADLAIERRDLIQEVPYTDLRARLEKAGQILEWTVK